MRDVSSALRFLLKKPGWAVAAVLTVAIGIAGSTLAFSLVDRALWRPLGFVDGRELVTLYARSGGEYSTIPWRDYVALRDVLHDDGAGPAALAAFVRTFSTVGGGEFPELHEGELVSGNFFSVLRVQPFLGRIIAPSDNVTPGAHPVVVLSHMLWRTQFASDPDVLGREVRLDGRSYEVIGVAPPGFRGPVWPSFESAFWIPAMMAADAFGADDSRVFGAPPFRCSRPSVGCVVDSGSRRCRHASIRSTRRSRATGSTIRTFPTRDRTGASRFCPATTCGCGRSTGSPWPGCC